MKQTTLALGFLVLAASSCASRRIPGTDIEDNRETRAVLAILETFRSAVEARDAERLISLVSPSFRDNGGTASTEDDLTFEKLKQELPGNFEKLADVRLELIVRKIEFFPQENTARAIYNYTSSFRLPGLTARPLKDSEIKEMFFKKEGNDWKILSGI